MKLLFVCTENLLRSVTAAAVFGKLPGIEAIGCGTSVTASRAVNGELLRWADAVFVMESSHGKALRQRFPEACDVIRIINLRIPDEYDAHDPVLVRLIEEGVMAAL